MKRNVFAIVLGLCLLTPVFADNSMLGTWEDKDKGMKIIFSEADGSVVAKITKGAATFEFDGYSLQETNGEATLTGRFADGKGNSYPFNAEASKGQMTFRTGKTEYHLLKQGVTPEAGGKAKNPLEEDDAPPTPAPAPNPMDEDKPNPPAEGGAYRHKSGLWSLTMPPAGWTREETPDGNTTKWTHPNGGLVFVTIVPDVPFNSAQEFFQKALGPGLQQNGAQFVGQAAMDEPGAPSFCASFNRTRNNIPEFGSCLCSVVDGKGLIFQMSMPQQQKDAVSQDMGRIFQSFRINK